jgi:hypothetical protein
MTSRREIEILSQRLAVVDGAEIHHEHDREGRLEALWFRGSRFSPLEFAEFARRILAR